MKKLSFIILTAVIVSIFALQINAKKDKVSVLINNKYLYISNLLLIDETTYVPAESFRKALGDNCKDKLNVYTNYIECNGRYIYFEKNSFILNNSYYVPIRAIAALYEALVEWDGKTNTVYVKCQNTKIKDQSEIYDADELYWLSRIINAESEGESLRGKIAVGNVVLNRVLSKDFPDTIYSVIFDSQYAIQFTPTENGRIYNEPTDESIIAAKICLEGFSLSNDILYFIYEDIADNRWTVYNQNYEFTIGCHDFYT